MSIPPNTTTLLRALKGAPLACLFALLICDHPASQVWLMQATGYSPNSVSAALRLLEELGLAQRLGPLGDWSSAGNSATRASLAAALAATLSPGANCAESSPEASKFEAPPGGGGYSISLKDNLYPPPPEAEPQIEALPEGPINPAQVSVERILEATRDLFGERMHGPPSRYRDRRLLLATIAEVYQQRYQLAKPARVAYSRLKNMITPEQTYLDDPTTHLPLRFLAAIGLRLPPVPLPELEPDEEDEGEIPEPEDEPPPHPSLLLPTGREGRLTIAQAWDAAREMLRQELPDRVYQRRAADIRLLSFDSEENVFVLAAPDAQTAAWLTDRLAKRLSHVLSGVCAQEVRTKFVIDQGNSEQ